MNETRNEPGGADTAERLGLAQLYSKRIAPTSGWSDMSSSDHFVQFYEADAFIVNSIAEYVIHGLKSGEICIVAATGEHLREIEHLIGSFATGLNVARAEGRYIPLDALDTLSEMIVDGMPDADLFSSVIGEILAKAVRSGREIRVFGEMVGVLGAQGNFEAAICLEDLWNRLRKKYQFSLFCAYPMGGLKHGAADKHMTRICDGHSKVIPDESYTALSSANERLRAIAVLQQRSMQLEAEVAELESRMASKQIGIQVA